MEEVPAQTSSLQLIYAFLKRYQSIFVFIFLFAVNIAAISFFVSSKLNLPYADAMSRLNIARKVVDNLNPGLSQLGSVWLPLPQVLMLPFIWNDYMWHSGLAGTIISSLAFILGGHYIYKAAYLISKSFIPSFFTLCMYALNINVFYLQTTAMSELLFIALMAAVMYYLLSWVQTDSRKSLILAGVALSGITLIRYEGLALLFSSIGLVTIYSLFKNRKRAEGNIILFVIMACLGFALWTLYLTVIFGDPLFWLRYYGFDPAALTDATVAAKPPPQAKSFMAAVIQYFTSVTWMTGLFPMLLAILGLIVGIGKSLYQKKFGTILVLLLPFSIFLLMVTTLRRNTPIVQPSLSYENIMSIQTSSQTGFNIRYGLIVFPWLVLLTVYIFNLKKPFYIPSIFFFLLFSSQLYNHYNPRYTDIYVISERIPAKTDEDMVSWLKQNYHGGKILVSASGFEDMMFMTGFPYKTFIHEGAGKYWSESLDRPARYADWIIIDINRESDLLAKELKHKEYWNWDYDVAWQGESVTVYKIKTQPDIILE